MRFVVITGVSGAGKSLTVKYLEDMGFFCVDNLPPSLIPKFAEVCINAKEKMEKVALVMDIRGGELLRDFFPGLTALEEAGIAYDILFLDSTDEVLIKRFKESRRSHPLSPDGRIIVGIDKERQILNEIKFKAKYVIDTSNLLPKQLRSELVQIVTEGKKYEGLIVSVISFGFKYGIPIDCDLIFDVRFIPNPYYIEALKKQSGYDSQVKDYVLNFEETKSFINKLQDMLEFLIPNYIKEGKNQLIIGIGCTGGRHRSVAITNEMGRLLNENHSTVVDHRDIYKDNRGK